MIGALRTRLFLEPVIRTPDDAGGWIESFAAPIAVWAQVVAKRSEEADAADRLRRRTLYEVTIRHRSDVAPGWRAQWGGGAARITAVRDPDARRRFLTLDAEEETL